VGIRHTELAVRYDGAFGSSVLVDAAFTWGWNFFKETPATNVYNIFDDTQIANGQRGGFNAQGISVLEPYDGNTRGVNGDITKTFHFAGTHSINVGYTWQFPNYNDHTFYAGPRYVIPSTNATGGAPGKQSFTDFAAGKTTDSAFVLTLASNISSLATPTSCTLCPYDLIPQANGTSAYQQVALQQVRGRFDGGVTTSSGKYHAAYINDAWQMSKYVTLNVGVRWEQQRLTGNTAEHTFSDMFSPRVGIAVDPQGNRKQKIYANFGRYAYVLPLDAALRSLSNEDDLQNTYWAPANTACPASAGLPAGATCTTKNALGTVDFIGDSHHLLNQATDAMGNVIGVPKNAGFLSSGVNNEPFATGTRMEFTDEFLVGYDREFKGGVVASVRYIDRRLKRVIEDQGGISVEQFNAGSPLNYVIGNPNAKQDIFVNPNETLFGLGTTVNSSALGAAVAADQSAPTTCPVSQPGCLTRATAAQNLINLGFPSACIDSNNYATPLEAFNQTNGFNAVTGGSPAGSVCLPAVNTGTWSQLNRLCSATVTTGCYDPTKPISASNSQYILQPDCTSLAQSKAGGCAAFGGEFYADGKPDTYKDPKREYEAVEFEVRKAFTHNWALSVNYRVAQLKGNYEGAFRNDNNQADPGISSLFDFTEGGLGLLAGQQSIGILSTDRKHTFNAHSTYVVPNGKLKGFVIGGGVSVLSGNPLTALYAQEAYQNAGEVPLFGRSNLGRSPVTGSVDAHLEYPFKLTERMQLKLAFDLFNIVDSTRQTTINQNGDQGFGQPNVDFQKPATNGGAASPAGFVNQGFVDPFNSRFSILLTF